MEKEFSVKIHLDDSEYYTAMRLVAGAVCTVAGTDVDKMDDFKLCVTESLLMLKNRGCEDAELSFTYKDGVRAEVRGESTRDAESVDEEAAEFSGILIRALMSGFEIRDSGHSLCLLLRL